jgi:transaldolase
MAVRKVSVEEGAATITAADVRDACDLLAPVAERQPGDGRVSLEVAPGLAHDTDATAAEAAHLWWLVDRKNLYIKIPATEAGLPAITTSISRGISVNVTLIFSLERYRPVMDAYLSGLEQRLPRTPTRTCRAIASVASFFVSRVDTEIDKRLEKAGADHLKGKAALANAQLAYQAYEEVFSSDRWKALEAKGARPQRPLWASTGVKNPEYSRHPVRQRARRPRHGQHDAGEDDEGLRRPRRARHARCRDLRRRRRGHEGRAPTPGSTSTTSSG